MDPETESKSNAGWKQPKHLGEAVLGRLLGAGGAASLIFAWFTIISIIALWDACDNMGAARAGLLVIGFPLLTAGFLLTFGLGIALSRARSSLLRFLMGMLLVLLAALLLTSIAPRVIPGCT